MDKLEVGLGKELANRETQRSFPGRVQQLQVTIEPGNAEEVEREGKETLQLLPGRRVFEAGRFVDRPCIHEGGTSNPVSQHRHSIASAPDTNSEIAGSG